MSRLLNANLARLFRSKLFWICAAASFAFALAEVFSNEELPFTYGVVSAEKPLLNKSGFFFLISEAVFTGIFVGAEHGGALRNKIIIGQKRVNIFLSHAITCSAAAVMLQFIFVSAAILTGLITGGKFVLTFEEIALYELLQLLSLVETSVLCSALSLLTPRKFGGAVASLLVLIVLLFLKSTLSALSRYEPIEVLFYDASIGRVEKQNMSDTEKELAAVYDCVEDINPFSQQEQIQRSFLNLLYYPSFLNYQKFYADEYMTYTIIPIPVEIAPFSLGTTAVTLIAGTLVFRKIDLK